MNASPRQSRAAPRLLAVIPTLNAADALPRTVDALRGAGAALQVDILVCDGGSRDETVTVAEALGLRVIQTDKGRGAQLRAGAEEALAGDVPDLLLFLHADSVPQPGWASAVAVFAAREDRDERAGYFRLTLDDDDPAARRLERMVAWRCRTFGLPYGDQGLLMTPPHYRHCGGFGPEPLMEDVGIVRRIGRGRMLALDGTVRTSAIRYRKSGYLRRSISNLFCLALYFMHVPPRVIARIYG